MKKAICIFLAVTFIVLTFCACKESGEETASTTAQTEFKMPDSYESILEVQANAKFNIYLGSGAISSALEPINEAAKDIYNEITYKNMPVENVVSSIISAANANKKLNSSDKIKLIFSVKKGNKENAQSILDSIKNCVLILPEIEESGVSVETKIKELSEKETTEAQTEVIIGETSCPDCKGTGKRQCDNCKNTAYIKCTDCDGKGYFGGICTLCNGNKTCTVCSGSGNKDGDYCVSCGGSGKCIRCLGEGKEPCETCNNPKEAELERRKGKILCPQCEGHCNEMCASCLGTGVVIKK